MAFNPDFPAHKAIKTEIRKEISPGEGRAAYLSNMCSRMPWRVGMGMIGNVAVAASLVNFSGR